MCNTRTADGEPAREEKSDFSMSMIQGVKGADLAVEIDSI
jgi:hypothetical protein